MDSSRRAIPPAVLAGGIAVATAASVPAAYLVLRAWEAGGGEVLAVLTEGRTALLLARTVLLALAVTTATVAIGVPVAWLTIRTDLPGRRALGVLTVLPLVIPSYVGGYALIAALGPRGIVQRWLEPLGVQRLPEIYGFFGAWLTLTLFSYPYVVLIVRAAIRRLDPALEEASLSLGVSRRGTFRRVVLPQLRPAIGASALLVALYAIHDFGAVSLLRFDSFTRAIYVSYSGSFDRSRAAILGLGLVAVTLVVVSIEGRMRGRAGALTGPKTPRAPAVSPLGRARWPAFGACAGLVTVALAMPAGVIAYWLSRSVREGEALGPTLTAGLHSLEVAALAAMLTVLAAWPVAVMSVRYRGRLARAVERVSYIGYALPGLVVALSLVFFGIRLAPGLYQTIALLVFAYIVLFLPQASGALRTSLQQVPLSLEEASHALGAARYRTLWRVVLPLLRPGAFAGAALVFLTVMKELPATLLLAPTGFKTLATEVFSSTNAAFFDRAAPPALALILFSSLPLAVFVVRDRAPERAL